MKQGLIIIDVQNDYFQGGNMELVGMEAAADNCQSLLNRFRQDQAPIFHIQHVSVRAGASFFVAGSEGCEINHRVKPSGAEPVTKKHFPSAFRDTGLQDLLKNTEIEQLVVCGAMTQMCVDTTVRAAFDLGYNCQVISDACATKDLEFEGRSVPASAVQDAFMASLNGLFAVVSTTDEFLQT